MRLALLNQNTIGKELALSIYLSNGTMFVREGFVFNERNIFILKNIGIETVYIKDENNDINLKEVIDTFTRIQIIKELKAILDTVKKDKFLDENKVMNIADKIIDNIDISENSFLLNNIGQQNNDLKLATHSVNVAILAIMVGKRRGYNSERLHKLALGAILHDIGKLFSEDEQHAKQGYEFVKSNTRIPVTSYLCILHHHEREDGQGYPEKLRGEKISEFAKIVALCNEYNNLLQSDKFAIPSMAIEYITARVGTEFSPQIFKEFISSVYCYPNGLYVKLSNGEKGIVVLQNNGFPTRPIVGVIKDGAPILRNLMQDLSLFIEKELL